jgi:bisphosphoglycerate-dependent phosphoglycerate mutase
MQKLVLMRHGESVWNHETVLPGGRMLIFQMRAISKPNGRDNY